MSECNKTDGFVRERAVGLFTYLKKLAEIRNTRVRNVANYNNVLWFSEIPKEQECFTPVWGSTKTGQEEIWLGIKKATLIKPPPVPANVKPWVDENDIYKSSDIPNLKEKIPGPATTDSSAQFVPLSDNPDISQEWEEYLDERWLPWAEEDQRLRRIQEVYSKLHAIYQLQKTLGEEYEIVVGLGLLLWKPSAGDLIKRHLLVAHACIELDHKKGTLFVKQNPEGAKIALEEDMLEVAFCCTPDIYNSIKNQISEIGDEVWDTPLIEAVLKTWLHSISAEGVYLKDLLVPNDVSEIRKIIYAPAVILRKRTQIKLVEAYNKIINQLSSDCDIPFGIERITHIVDDKTNTTNGDKTSNLQGDFQNILFPLPSNDDQMRIVEYLRSRQGVLVQGPPGTGKSHTIVNLICHLLAEGKRILVTSQTPRALKVLKSMIPKEVSALCVHLLGSDNESLKSLGESVNGIVARKFKWDQSPLINAGAINRLTERIHDLKKMKSKTMRRIHEVRDSATYEHSICNRAYVGTRQKIGERLLLEKQKFDWLNVNIPVTIPAPLSNIEATEFVELYQSLSPKEVEELQMESIRPADVIGHEQFAKHVQEEQKLKIECAKFDEIRQSAAYEKMSLAPENSLIKLQADLNHFLQMRATLLKHQQPWVSLAMKDVIADRDRKWRHLLETSQKYLNKLGKHVEQIDQWSVIIPEQSSHAVVKADAEGLFTHFEKGGKLGWFISRPKPVKQAWYLVTKAYVNGRLCNTLETVRKLLVYLEVEDCLELLWREWSQCVNKMVGSKTAQLHELNDLCEPLSAVIALHSQLSNARQSCKNIEGLPEPAWNNTDEVHFYCRVIDAVKANRALHNSTSTLKELQTILHASMIHDNTHPVVSEMYESVTNRNESAYANAYHKLLSLEQRKPILARRQELHSRLSESPAKHIAENLANNPNIPDWKGKLSNFESAWQWAQARTWLSESMADNEERIARDLNVIDEDLKVATAELAAEWAWKHCFTRLEEPERQHLMGWANAMRLVGKGTGRHAEKHRRDARHHMEYCQKAIPAWIMPLYRIAETVEPSPNSYDVAIIDEASQSGPDALLLKYLAKQIVVVGDDKQISPVSAGIDREDVDKLREQYIQDLPNKDSLGPDSSFFDLAGILFSGRIVLQEHFRCMPEIIQFSNNLCYSATPLRPLRQYPPNRLEPVMTCYVSDGYRDGGTGTPRNLPEAEAIVKTITECCKNPRYYGKSMGVISLLGAYQARDLIDGMLLKAIGPEEMAKRNIICGDAYAFQGDERDIMFLSMVAAPGETQMRALANTNDIQRFNVAASRAKDQMWLFHTPTLNDFHNHDCVRYKLLEYCLNPSRQQTGIDIDVQKLRNDSSPVNRTKFPRPKDYDLNLEKYFDSWFEIDVFLMIVDRGYHVVPQFETAGYSIDMVVEGAKTRLAVECDGDYHQEPEQREKDILRQRVLERAGLKFWRVSGGDFYFDRERAMASLWEKLDYLEIVPGGRDKISKSETTVTDINESNGELEDKQCDEKVFNNNDSVLPLEPTKQGQVFSPEAIQDAIVSVLKLCPNNSCTKKSLTSRVCRYLGIITRGSPRRKFDRRVMDMLDQLENRQIVEEYKATNVRIRLAQSKW